MASAFKETVRSILNVKGRAVWSVAPEARPSAALLRISVGLEALTDLQADLDQALATA